MDANQQFVEQTLIVRSQGGDAIAFARLVEMHHGPILYFVRRLIGERESADVMQEIWWAIYRQLPRLKDLSLFRSWMYRIARNHAVDAIRSRRRMTEPLIEEPINEAEAEPEFSPEDAAKIHVGLARLRLEHREVLVLRFLESMSYQEIADVVVCDVGTVKSRLFYAKHALSARNGEAIVSQMNPLGALLLKADPITTGTLSEDERAALFRKVEMAEQRQLRSRNIMYACWALLGAGYLATNVFHIVGETSFSAATWGVMVGAYFMLLWFTMFVTVQTIVRLGIVRGAQLNARLASIENLLAVIAQSRK